MRLFFTAAAVAAVLALQSPVGAAEAPEHPVVKHYPGAKLSESELRNFDAVDLVTGFAAGSDPVATIETVEGKVFRYQYDNDPAHSPLQIVRNYEAALRKVGFAPIVVIRGDKAEIPNVGSGDWFGAFRLDKDGAPRLLVNVKATTDTTYVWSEVTVVELRAMEQDYAAGADALYDGLAASGRVAVYGITFETGRAAIQPASDKVLAEVRTLLQKHPELRLKVEGHTDNVGAAAANKTLSEARAAAVKAHLVAQGVAENRLVTAGFGDAKPVAPNDSEAGRAKNRRVELVRM